jgi:hypothetical protein
VRKIKTKNKNTSRSLLLILILFPFFIPPLASASSNNQWNLHITSLNGTSINLSYEDLLALPKTTVSADLSCYGNLVSSGAWGGVRLSDLLNIAVIDPSVVGIELTAQDGYLVSIPINTAMSPDVIVAYDLDGSQLNEVLRLVVPDANGNIWIAGITSIEMSAFSVDQIQSGTSGQSIANQYQTIVNTTTQAPPQLQTPVEIQPIVPSNETLIEPITPPTIVTLPQSEQKITGQMNSSFLFEFVLIFLGAAVLVVVIGFVFYSRKRR